jgi:hypothetical protein
VEKAALGLFQSIELSPAVDFRQLEEVFVILDRREMPANDEFSSESDELWAGAQE